MGRCGCFISRIRFLKTTAVDWMSPGGGTWAILQTFIGRRWEWPGESYHAPLITPHWSCGEAPASVILSFSKRRQLSTGGVHLLAKALKIPSFPPTSYPKLCTQAGTLLKTQACLLPGQLRLYTPWGLLLLTDWVAVSWQEQLISVGPCPSISPALQRLHQQLSVWENSSWNLCLQYVSCNGCPGCNRKICCLVVNIHLLVYSPDNF